MQATKQRPDRLKWHHALFFLDQNDEADGRVNHYCTLSCCHKDSERLRKAGENLNQETSVDCIEGTQCDNCGMPLDGISNGMDILGWFCLDKDNLLNTFPGEIYQGDITGHGHEWRTELVLDYCPSDESEESENEYILVFSLLGGLERIIPCLRLEYNVAEVGITEKHDFDLTKPDTIDQELALVTDKWDMHKDANKIAEPLINKINEIRKATLESSPIDWMKSGVFS